MNLEEEMNKVAIERVVDFEVKKGHVVNETEKTIDYEDAIRIAKAYAEAMCERQKAIDESRSKHFLENDCLVTTRGNIPEIIISTNLVTILTAPLATEDKCSSLQKRFDVYANAINQIDDFFEYRYRNYGGEQTKDFVLEIIDNITKQLEEK